MIVGLDLDASAEGRVRRAFETWSDHFRRRFAKGGVPWLLEQYTTLIASVETQSCSHGPDAPLQTGDAWRLCCGFSDEYQNDISVRDAIRIVLEEAPAEATRSLAAETAVLDARLYALYSNRPDRVGRWWRQGLPDGVVE